MKTCSCIQCHQAFNNYGGLVSHFEIKHEKQLKYRSANIPVTCLCCKTTLRDNAAFEAHWRHWRHCSVSKVSSCLECGKWYHNTNNTKFCSSSCSGTHSNRLREESGWTMLESSRESIRQSLDLYRKSNPKPKLTKLPRAAHSTKVQIEKESPGPFTKIFHNKCKFCQTIVLSPKKSCACQACQHLKWNNNKDQYSFKFNIFKYPDLFDLPLLKQVGFVSFGENEAGPKT